jgi:hypothetical protein
MMIIKQIHGYEARRKYIQGKGFVDSLRSIGSYVSQNKDLIAKPLLGAVGNLAAAGLTEGTKALLNHIISKKPGGGSEGNSPQLDPKSLAILQNIIGAEPAMGNIIGSGRTGGGIKKF